MSPEDTARELLASRIELTGWLRSLVRDRGAAEDLFQDLCVKAVGRAAEFGGTDHLRRWFLAAGRNAAIDFSRRSARRPCLLGEEAIDALAADEVSAAAAPVAGWHRRLEALRACLATLTPRAREVVVLRYGDELAGGEVARRLDRKIDSIYKSLARTYEHLRDCIRRHEAWEEERRP